MNEAMNSSLSVAKVEAWNGLHTEQIVPDDAPRGVFRIIEDTGAGWFMWPDAYGTRESATAAMNAWLRRGAQ